MALTMASGELPEEIIQKILEMLPVKSLMRFTCVSKWWGSIITDLKFAKSHYLLASQQQTLPRRLLLWNNCQFESLDLETSSLRKLTFPINRGKAYEPDDVNILGSCNGLVFLCAIVDGGPRKLDCFGFYVWNPSTGFVRNLPAPSFHCDSLTKIRHCGFCYVSATDDYKVVLSTFIKGKYIYEIFSWRANSWKRIEGLLFETPLHFFRFKNYCQGTVSNEALHWIEIFDGEEAVLVFDMVSDVFRKLQLPIRNRGAMTTLGVCGRCLSAAIFEYHQGEYVELWVMSEYNVPESWTKLYIGNQIPLPCDDNCNPFFLRRLLFCWESCIFTLELLNSVQLNRLNRFNLQEGKTDYYAYNPRRNSDVIGYDESTSTS